MSKIKELLMDEKNVLVFDIDGVLALMELGDHNHYSLNDEDWTKACEDGINYYDESIVSKKMQEFLKTRDMSRIYVITAVGNNNEGEFKREYANKYYNIPKENVFFVSRNIEKTEQLKKIKEKYPELENYRIVMVDDTVKILDHIMNNTEFSTVHISSFLDI